MNRRMIHIIILLLCSLSVKAEKPYRIYNSFNSGELTPLLSAREDLAKYQAGCSIMENVIPLPQGGAMKRPGTKYIAEVKDSSLATRIIPFEYSTEQSYIIELGNQYMRFYTNGAQIFSKIGTEDISSLNNIVGHWLLNDNAASQTVLDDDGETYNGATVAGNTTALHAAGKVGTGCFDFAGVYAVEITNNVAFNFGDGADDSAFSIIAWIHVIQANVRQVIFSKWKAATDRQYRLSLNESQQLELALCDDSASIDVDLTGHWKMNDDAADKIVADSSAENNDGASIQNTEDIDTTGKIDGALTFNGSSDKITIGNGTEYDFERTDSFSFAFWAKPTSGSGQMYTVLNNLKIIDSSERGYNVTLPKGGTGVGFNLISAWSSKNLIAAWADNCITPDDWNFVVVTYDGSLSVSGVKIYVNGISQDLETVYDALTATTKSGEVLTIGARQYGNYFYKGAIDNVMVFERELSQTDVTNIYNSNKGTETLAMVTPYAETDAALTSGWHFVAATYPGQTTTPTTAASLIKLYVDGALADSTAYENSQYTAMEVTTIKPRIGAQIDASDSLEHIYQDKIDGVALFKDVLTDVEIASLCNTSNIYEIDTPYLTNDLFELKYEQSADVLYITHPDYETRKLSRLANASWTITPIDIQSGPFRTQNDDVASCIAASATTGSVTLTATGCTPFVIGTTAGHLPSGTLATSKSQTGALFKLVYPLDILEYSEELESDFAAGQAEDESWVDCGILYKGAEWTLVTQGTWNGTIKVQRNYTLGAAVGNGGDEGASVGWETVFSYSGLSTARNVSTTGTEDDGDAQYRVIFAEETGDVTVEVLFSTDQTEVVGVVEITSVASSTSAIGTVLKTLGSTDATHKWSEGAWSNYRGWPQTVTFFEDRLCFGGNTAQPDTIWASVTGDYENFTEGVDDDDALNFTLSSRQVNVIEWLIGKDKILIGTSGAEWTLGGAADGPLTPSSVESVQQSTYGSANLQATLANESVLFFQRGKEKMRELAYNWELDSYVAPDMTLLANLVTDSGIDDTAFQKTPDSILWCVRGDGELPVFSYERGENITAWARMVTQTNLAGTLTDSDFESVAVIHGDPEDEVWVIVKRVINGSTVRYIEQFQPRDFGSDAEDAFYVDCGVTYDSTASSTMTGLDHLEGQTLYVLADGVVFDTADVSGGEITLKLNGTTTKASTVQMGLGYEVNMRTMPLSWIGGETIQGRIKKIGEVVTSWYNSGDFSVGKDADNLQTYSISGQTTSQDRKTFPAGWDRNGYVYIYQHSPEPLTILGIMTEFNLSN